MMRAFRLMLILALSVAPIVEAAHHGPGAQAVEMDHHAFHFEHGHGHGHGTDLADHHDASDHDHVSTVVLIGEGTAPYPEPDRQVQPGPAVPSGFPPDGPRRPPRPTMI